MCEVPGLPFPGYTLPTLNWRTIDPSFGLAGFIDVETTGLSPYTDEIVEFAMVLFAFDRTESSIVGVVDEYVGLREPGRNIPPQATRVHGITDADVVGQQLDHAKIKQLIQQAEFFVAHNASFDQGFVTRLFPVTNINCGFVPCATSTGMAGATAPAHCKRCFKPTASRLPCTSR